MTKIQFSPKKSETDTTLLSKDDLYLFNEGTHFHLYDKFGAHLIQYEGTAGTYFAAWAPNAEQVSVVGNFNSWKKGKHALSPVRESGVWEGFFPGIGKGALYKFHIRSRIGNYEVEKTDPFAVFNEIPPKTASIVWDLDYAWRDTEWMNTRSKQNCLNAPISIYEMHVGSWKRVPEEKYRSLSYRELAATLPAYLEQMGFTHVEFLPVMDHPFFGSWGYQTTGYFAPTGNYGTPQDFMYLIDELHLHGIGVILDWVPSHFPTDGPGLSFFDGTHLFEHADPRQGIHPDWNTYIFNYGSSEVRSFLISSALFWLSKYHVDGLRVDAVASMLYLDYSRKPGVWIPNQYGGRENLDAVRFLQELNATVYRTEPGAITVAEESTAWPGVTRPTHLLGLGFGFKWNMGWMHDTLDYASRAPVFRSYHHHQLTFSMMYAYSENFILPLSHDEVVHGKGSLVRKMPGDRWQQLATLRALFGYMWAHPGKQLLFMGGEFGQEAEWSDGRELDWWLLDNADNRGIQRLVTDLNRLYRECRALWSQDYSPDGFGWIDANDASNNVFSFLRHGDDGSVLACVVNFAGLPHEGYQLGLPQAGVWDEVLNTDAETYCGSGVGNLGQVLADQPPWHGQPHSAVLRVPPLGTLWLRHRG